MSDFADKTASSFVPKLGHETEFFYGFYLYAHYSIGRNRATDARAHLPYWVVLKMLYTESGIINRELMST